MDRYKNSIQAEFKEYCSSIKDDRIKYYLSSNLKFGIGKPIVCAYQFINCVNKETDGFIYQYFIYDTFKIAIRLHDFSCKTFYGHMASHRTALPVLVRKGKLQKQQHQCICMGKKLMFNIT